MKNLQKLTMGAGALLILALSLRLWGSFLTPHTSSNPGLADMAPALTDPGATGADGSAGPEFQGGGVFRRVAGTPPPDFSARAMLIADPVSGEILFNFNPGMRWPMASLTKLMTAHIIVSHMDLSRIYTLQSSDFAGGGNSLTASLAPGQRYLGRDLFKVMLVSSSNEAAAAFARTYGEDAFLKAMNDEAAAMGLADTHFADPAGLSAGNQSTARDTAALVARLWKTDPDIFAATRNRAITVYEMNSGAAETFQSTNDFAGQADFLGGKTGTTPEANENLLSLFSYGGHPVMILVFGSENRFAETRAILNWFTHDFIPGN